MNNRSNIFFDNSFDSIESVSNTIKKCCHFLFGKNRTFIIYLLILTVLLGLIPSVSSIFLENITDTIEQYTDKDLKNINLVSVLFKWIIIYAVWTESINIVWRIYDYVYLKVMPLIKAQVVDEFYDYIQYHSHEFFQAHLAGELSNRVTEAAESLEMIFTHANEGILRKFSVLLFALVTFYTVHEKIALVFLLWVIIFVSTSFYFSKTINLYSSLYGKSEAVAAGKIVDAISNISIIRMFASHKKERRYLNKYLDKTIEADQRMQWFMFKLRYFLGVSCSIMIGLIIYYIISLRSNLEISLGQCALVIALCASVTEDIADLTEEFGELFDEMGVFSQCMNLLCSYKINDNKDAKELKIINPSIEFKNATFRYQNNDNKFENQSLFINAYERIGLAGFSGSGKTTFSGLISRLYELEEGSILIDGQDIKNVTQDSLRCNISVIPQEPILFHRSIMENIRYGRPDANDEEVYEAAKSAYIHDVIEKLPNGYNTVCGERGNNLSGGQRQRIIIARAFLKQASILILDEATSSLDSHTEYFVHKSLQRLMLDKTVLVIAHRLSTLLNMDRILVFNKGHVVEDGPHLELQKSGEIYKTLWKYY